MGTGPDGAGGGAVRILTEPRALVLMYHRVVDVGRDPFWLHVSPEQFRAHLEVLADSCDVVPLERIREPFRGRRRVAITFDDGYLDNLEAAAPALDAAGMAATVFVVSDLLEGTRPFWWDRLDHLLGDTERREPLAVDLGGRRLRVDLADAGARARGLQVLAGVLRPLPAARREALLEQLSGELGVPIGPCACHAHLSPEQVVELDAAAGIDIGAHTRSHPCLRTLPAAAQVAEIAGSRRALEDALGHPVTTFAYPFGSHDSWDATTVRAAARSGVSLAVTTISGDVSGLTPRLRVPRVAVRGWGADTFSANLETWFRGGRTEWS